MAVENLTKSLLAELSRGIAVTRIKAVPANGEVDLATLTFATGGGLLYSVEGSLQLDWPEPDISEIRVDQGLQTIAMDIEKGDISFAANYPTSAEAALTTFFKASDSNKVITTETGTTYTGKSIFLEPKTTEVSICIEDENQQYCIAMARVSLTARLAYDQDNRIWYIGLNGRVLTNLKDGEGDAVVAKRDS